MQKKYLRIIDANFNRAKEALRVAEDVVRFLLEDRALSRRYKASRHRLSQILTRFPVPYRRLVEARDSVRDVGKEFSIQDLRRGPRWQEIAIANLKRSQEALRVLEEMSKIILPARSRQFERLRFQLYELEKRTLRKF